MKRVFIVIWCFCFFLSGTAQTIRLTEKNGNSTQIAMNQLRSVTFSAGNLFLNIKTGTPFSYPIADVQSLKFLPQTLDRKSVTQNSTFSLFPNPVTDYINMAFPCIKTGNVLVEIIGLQGNVLSQNTFNTESNSKYSMNLSALRTGMYICRFICGNEVSSIRFIKK